MVTDVNENKWRKKPVVIEAVQITEDMVLDHCLPTGVTFLNSGTHAVRREVRSFTGEVTTIHGQKTKVVLGDWIITEPDGVHHYPCKPDIFDATYDKVAPQYVTDTPSAERTEHEPC